jgi:hypothetical protein
MPSVAQAARLSRRLLGVGAGAGDVRHGHAGSAFTIQRRYGIAALFEADGRRDAATPAPTMATYT